MTVPLLTGKFEVNEFDVVAKAIAPLGPFGKVTPAVKVPKLGILEN